MLMFNKFDLIKVVSQVVDLVNTTLSDHHLRTGFLADQICRRLDLKRPEHHLVVLSAMLHDLGVVPLGLKADDLLFETDMEAHSRAGWMFLRFCPQLREEARLVRYHHLSWTEVRNLPEAHRRAGELANIIHLADFMDISSRGLVSPRRLRVTLKGLAGRIFSGEYVEVARDLLFTPDLFPGLGEAARRLSLPATEDLALTEADSTAFAHLFSKLIDSRSPFTAMHSTVVASLSLLLHHLAGGREEDVQSMYLAGLLHDVGKLAVPLELIEKPGPLTEIEFAKVSEHARLSYQTLSSLPGFHRVAVWGACHHERLDGSGYPEGLTAKDLPMESRMVAVADVLGALTENRPYRAGLSPRAALSVLDTMAKSRALDGDLVGLVGQNLCHFAALRRDVHNENRTFLRTLVKDLRVSADNRHSAAWREVLGQPAPPA